MLIHETITENFDDVTVRLVFEAMLDKNISGNADMEGLTHAEVRGLLEKSYVTRVLLDGQVIGVYKQGTVDKSCYHSWGLEKGKIYSRIGFVYIDPPFRNKGYGTDIMREHIANCENYAECCAKDNLASKAMLSKVLTFHKEYYNGWRDEMYLSFIK